MRFISATQVFDGTDFLGENTVLILDEKSNLIEIRKKEQVGLNPIEHYEGIICPGFVNAHCHLELSHLHKSIHQKTGITGFATEIIGKRMQFQPEEIQIAMLKADEELRQGGIVLTGDISNTPDSIHVKSESKIYYHTFIELLGLNPALANFAWQKGQELISQFGPISSSLTAHASYSVSPELMSLIANEQLINLPISIHNQESQAENDFFLSGNGLMNDLYKNLGIDLSYFKAPGMSALQHLLKYQNRERNLILVHNTFTNPVDIQIAEKFSDTIYWCFCPNANLYIENVLPNIHSFIANSCKIIIGTDSLASNERLDLLSEVNVLLRANPPTSITEVLKWITKNGAQALNQAKNFGGLLVGKNAGLNLVKFEANKISFLKKLA